MSTARASTHPSTSHSHAQPTLYKSGGRASALYAALGVTELNGPVHGLAIAADRDAGDPDRPGARRADDVAAEPGARLDAHEIRSGAVQRQRLVDHDAGGLRV